MLDISLAVLLGRLDTPAGEHLIGIVIVTLVAMTLAPYFFSQGSL